MHPPSQSRALEAPPSSSCTLKTPTFTNPCLHPSGQQRPPHHSRDTPPSRTPDTLAFISSSSGDPHLHHPRQWRPPPSLPRHHTAPPHLPTHRRSPTSISPPPPSNSLADASHRPHFTPCMGVAAFTAHGASSLLLSWRGWELWDHEQDTSSHPPPAPLAARGTSGVLLDPILRYWVQEDHPSEALWPSHLGPQNVVLKWVPSPGVQEASPTQSRGI